MIGNAVNIPIYRIWLEDNTKLAPRSIKAYTRVAAQYLLSSPNVHDANSYLNFLVETAVKKRCYQNVSALLMFIKYFIYDDKERKKIRMVIKALNIKTRASIKYQNKKPLTDDELNLTISKLEKPKHKMMSIILYFTGMRIGEVLSIKKGSIYFETEGKERVMKISCIQKGGEPKIIWIWDMDIADIIMNYVNTHDTYTEYIFVDYAKNINTISNLVTAQDLNYIYYWDDLKQALAFANIDPTRFAAHSFRRAYARRVWLKFKDLDILKRLMGHADVKTSLIYLQQHGYHTSQAMKDFQLT